MSDWDSLMKDFFIWIASLSGFEISVLVLMLVQTFLLIGVMSLVAEGLRSGWGKG